MSHGRKNLFHQIFGTEAQARSIDAGMAADQFSFQYIFIDQKLYPVFFVIHQSQHTHGARCDIQKFFHILVFGERESCRANLGRKLFCLKFLIPWHHQEIKPGLLPVAQEEIFTDRSIKNLVDRLTVLHRHGCFVVDPLIINLQLIQKIISPDLLFQSPDRIFRPSIH